MTTIYLTRDLQVMSTARPQAECWIVSPITLVEIVTHFCRSLDAPRSRPVDPARFLRARRHLMDCYDLARLEGWGTAENASQLIGQYWGRIESQTAECERLAKAAQTQEPVANQGTLAID